VGRSFLGALIRYFVLKILPFLLFAGSALAFGHSYRGYQDSVLVPFVQDGRVDYAGLAANPAPLEAFLASCGAVSFKEYKQFTREEELCFLLNLYNAATLKLVIDHWPLSTVQGIGGAFESPWTVKFVRLFDHTVGLGNILHDILRVDFHDPRVHFALPNAAGSGPLPLREAFRPLELEKQLEDCSRSYLLERPELNHLKKNTLYLSPLLKWYSNDFGRRSGVIAFARRYFPDVNDNTRIEYTNFDWGINGR
jgi:hypothetical protein